MNLRDLRMPVLAIVMALGAGCSHSNVPAIAPGDSEHLTGAAAEGGQYVLYRAMGSDHDNTLTYEKVWSVNAQKGETLGFRWVTDEAHRWDKSGAFHLVAFADNEMRDLGPIVVRDAKYVWAGADVDLDGYFRHLDHQKTFQAVTLQ